MVAAYKTLCLRKRFKDAVRGWVKCFEITYNWNTGEYHPHYHCVLVVDKNYFTSNLFIQQDEWCLLWQSCLGVDYKPIVDIRVFKDSEKGKGKEVAEVAKYTIKSSNIMANLQQISPYNQDVQDEVKKITNAITDEIVSTLDSALANRRLIEYGGIMKIKHKELNLTDDTDNDNADLIHIETDSPQNGTDYMVERYRWDIGLKNYVRIEDERE
jgi:plasmid rolling circle replication initiator protein Rep